MFIFAFNFGEKWNVSLKLFLKVLVKLLLGDILFWALEPSFRKFKEHISIYFNFKCFNIYFGNGGKGIFLDITKFLKYFLLLLRAKWALFFHYTLFPFLLNFWTVLLYMNYFKVILIMRFNFELKFSDFGGFSLKEIK